MPAVILPLSLAWSCAAPAPRAADESPVPAPDRTRAVRARARAEGGERPAPPSTAAPESPGEDDIFAADADRLELQAVLAYARDHSPRLRAARYRSLAAESRARAAGWLPDPRFSWSHGFEEIQSRNGPIRDVFSLSQSFPYFGRLRQERRAAGARSDAEHDVYLMNLLAVLADVQKAYFAIGLTEREITINDRTHEILEEYVDIALSKTAAGKGGQHDNLLAEIELSRVENERIDLEQRLETERALLNTLLDRKPSAHLPPVTPPDPMYRADLDSLLAWMLESLPDLARHRHRIEENRAHLRIAELRYVPDVTVGVTYTNVADSLKRAGAIHSGRDAIAGTVGINLPLWLPKYRAETRAAREALEAARAARADIELASVYRVIEMHVRVETALRQVELLRDVILPNSRQAVEVLERAYETGTLDFLKLLDAERALERFELELVRASTEFEHRLADLERAVGKPLREETKP